MPNFNSLSELAKYVQEHYIDKVLEDEVAWEVKKVEAEMVEKIVYGTYTSQEPYAPRRHGMGGLQDKRNMVARVFKGVLTVKNYADGNDSPPVDYTTYTHAPDFLAGIIEYGREPNRRGLYTHNKTGTEYEYLRPRRFTKATIDKLRDKNRKILVDAMKKGLKSQGLEVK